MCKNAESTALTLAEGIEPTVIQILTLEGLASSTEGQAAINAFNTLITSLKTWQPGTGAQDVIQAIDAFTAVFNVLPFPDTDKTLVDIVVAGVTTLIGILTANSPAPAPPAGQTITASPEVLQQAHASTVETDTAAKVAALVPGFKRSRFHSPEWQYRKAWNTAVKALPEKYQVLEQ